MPVYEVAVTKVEEVTIAVLADSESEARSLATSAADDFDHVSTDATVVRTLDDEEVLDRAHEVVRA